MDGQPLAGFRVLAIEHFIAAPFGTMWLADAGAEVIKIEPPGTGEAGRLLPDSLLMLRHNRNKRSVTLDLKSELGNGIFRRLVASADAVVSNLGPGALDRLGLGYDVLRQIKPDLVYVTATGFGQAEGGSPFSHWPAMDIIAQAMAGLLLRAGQDADPPVYFGVPLADLFTSVLGAYSVLLGLVQRSASGRGAFIDLAMYDAALCLNEHHVTAQAATGQPQARGGYSSTMPVGAFRASDGYFVIQVTTKGQWVAFCQTIDRPDLDRPEYDSGAERYRRGRDEIGAAIETWAGRRSVREVVESFVRAKVPAAPVQDIDSILGCPHVAARDMLLEIDNPDGGHARAVGNPIKLVGQPQPAPRPAPELGADTDDILTRLAGVTPDEMRRLRTQGVI